MPLKESDGHDKRLRRAKGMLWRRRTGQVRRHSQTEPARPDPRGKSPSALHILAGLAVLSLLSVILLGPSNTLQDEADSSALSSAPVQAGLLPSLRPSTAWTAHVPTHLTLRRSLSVRALSLKPMPVSRATWKARILSPRLDFTHPPAVTLASLAVPPTVGRMTSRAGPEKDERARPMIAIVIDDLGEVGYGVQRALRLPAAITLSFLPLSEGVEHYAQQAQLRGHEILIHMPMEPESGLDPGTHALKTTQSPEEIKRHLTWALGRLSGYVGINNHMGSRFSENEAGMRTVLAAVGKAGLFYLDSRTSAHSVAPRLAKALGVPVVERDVFLDNELSSSAILSRMIETEKVAKKAGSAIAIGHPHELTLDMLDMWLSTVESRGYDIVPLSKVVDHRTRKQMKVALSN